MGRAAEKTIRVTPEAKVLDRLRWRVSGATEGPVSLSQVLEAAAHVGLKHQAEVNAAVLPQRVKR